MEYYLQQETNPLSKVVGRWFAHAKRKGTLTTRGLAQHMIDHGLVGNRADVEAMITKLSECIPELVAQGYGVKLDALGIFYPTIANEKGGAEKPEDFNPAQHVHGIRFRFNADSTKLDSKTAQDFMKRVSLVGGYKKVGDDYIRIKDATSAADSGE